MCFKEKANHKSVVGLGFSLIKIVEINSKRAVVDFFMCTLVPVFLLKCETTMLLQKKIKEKSTLGKPEKLSGKNKKNKGNKILSIT